MSQEIRTIQALAEKAGIDKGTLIRIAREISEDGTVMSLGQLRKFQRERLVDYLNGICARRSVAAA
jgi:hypothetical protein